MRIDRLIQRLAAATFAAAALTVSAAAQVVLVNGNVGPVGFNDPTPALPVGGNSGTTLGQQRVIAFLHAASLWGAQLDSAVPIRVIAGMLPLTCNASSAVLAQAGTQRIVRDFPAAPVAGHWYHGALANKLQGVDFFGGLTTLQVVFNSNLGNANCLAGSGWYMGLDGQHGNKIDIVAVLLHEFGHGLGFSTLTSGTTGAQFSGFPTIYDNFAYDNTAGKLWNQMTNAERVVSAVNARNLVWTGSNVTASAPSVLLPGTPRLQVIAPDGSAATYQAGMAQFGEPLGFPGLTRQAMQVVDQANGTGLACSALNDENARAVKNRIAIVDRGVCGFIVKAKNVQDAGAVGMIVVENVVTTPPADLGGVDPAVVIPAVRVSLATGNTLKAALGATPSGRSSGLVVRMGLDPSQLAGADTAGRVMLFSPNPFQGGSSVSHFDTSAFRNLLMEPFNTANQPHSMVPPNDLTMPMFRDIGW